MEALINVWKGKLSQHAVIEIPNISAWEGHSLIRKHDCAQVKDLLFKNSRIVRIKNTPATCSSFGLKLFIDELVCLKKRITPWDLEECIRSSSLYPEIIPVARSKYITCFIQTSLDAQDTKHRLLKDILPALKQVYVRGEKHKAKTSWANNILRTKGMNLKGAFEVFPEKWKTIVSTNILEVLDTLGIEAARAVLLKELNKVFNDGVRQVYLLTLAEWMSFQGSFTPVTRNGILRSNKNAFKNMAFEQCLKTAMRNATEKTVSDFSGTTERILVNHCVQQGTGICKVIGEDVLMNKVQENAGGEEVQQFVEEDDEFMIYGGL